MADVFSGGGTESYVTEGKEFGYHIKLYCSTHGRDFDEIIVKNRTIEQANTESREIHDTVERGAAATYFGTYECPLCAPLCDKCEALLQEQRQLKKQWGFTDD